MRMQDGESRKHCPRLSETELSSTLTPDVVVIHVTEHEGEKSGFRKSFSVGQSSLGLSSPAISASRMNDGVVVRVEGCGEREDHPHSSSFYSPSNLSLVSLHGSPGEKTLRRKKRAERCKSPSLDVGERNVDGKECHESSGHKSRSRSSHFLAPLSDGNDHGRRYSVKVPNQQIPVKRDKRKNSYSENEVPRTDRRSSSSSRRSSRVEDLARRSSRVPSKSTKNFEDEQDKENIQLEEGTRRRKMVIIVICSVSLFILITSVVLVAVTLSLSPTIDQLD
ncbi:uncharacterized protein LOC111086504 isoform X2 [Limulus polyphemus]|uniref:Uncharacterized protein LOC111086504 isoform X2 n=1 Tax=Limulus polyphemus TaxID=6850 RepID=A0ABM1SNY7_LIMPO|nr:uncharacterized protein LOC111086504 isoform X2 [Limulus polyphemus]